MRCSICGYDVEAPLTRCPMCGGVIVHPSQPDGPAEEVSQVQIEAEVQDQPETGTPEISFRDAQLVRTFVPAWEEPRAPRSAEIESISWDTKDFARPKKVQDIEMQWPEYTKHNLFAASDGPEKTEKPSKEEVPVQSDQIVQTAADRPERFMSVRDAEDLAAKYEKTEPSAPENVKAEAPAVKYESAEALAAKYESAESLAAKYESTEVSEAEYGPAAEYKPEAEYGPGSGSASSDPEEPVIDALGSEEPAVDPSEPEIAPAEIEELEIAPTEIEEPDIVPTEPEAPEIAAAEPETPETTSPEQEAEPSSDAFEFTVEGLMRQASEPDEEPEVTSDEDKTKTFRVEDLIPEQKGSERPMFYTFQTKTDEFQKLLDKEYERIHSMYGEDYDPLKGATVPPFEPEEKVQAQSLSDFERMLMEDVPEQKEQTAAQKFFSQSPADASAEEQPIDFDSEDWKMSADPTKMTIEQIENTIRELEADEIREAEQSSERKKRLEAMAAARDEYFRNLDRYDKRGRLIKKKDQEPVSAPAPEVRPSELTAEDLVKARDAAEPADTIIRDISRNAYTPAADAEAATPEGPKTDASYEPKSFDDIYQSIFGVRPVSSENRAAEAPAVSKDVSEPLAVSEAPAAAEAGPSVSKAASAAAPVAAAVAGIAAAAAIKSEVSEPAAPAEESALTASAADTADRLAPEQEMEKKLEELEKLYSVDTAEAKAETHNSPAISFFFDQEAPQQISDADELLDVNEIIEEKPFDKDDLTITNETSSLAFL